MKIFAFLNLRRGEFINVKFTMNYELKRYIVTSSPCAPLIGSAAHFRHFRIFFFFFFAIAASTVLESAPLLQTGTLYS